MNWNHRPAKVKITYCPNGHVYDQAIYAECPYCKKIRSNQQALEREIGLNQHAPEQEMGVSHQLEFDRQNQNLDDDDEATVLIDYSSRTPGQQVRESRTSGQEARENSRNAYGPRYFMPHPVTRKEQFNTDSEAKTEQIPQQMRSSARETERRTKRRLAGWLVRLNGPDAGSSMELYSGPNYLCLSAGRLQVKENSGEDCMARIDGKRQDQDAALEVFSRNVYQVNFHFFRGDRRLENEDCINIGGCQFAYIELPDRLLHWR